MIYTILTSGGTTISFDCITSATINRTATITSHPTERGSPISDHVFFSNLTIGMSGIVTDLNLYNPQSRTAGGSVFFDADGNIKAANLTPTESAFELLKQVFEGTSLVTVIESTVVGEEVESYTDCVIKSLSKKDSPENGGSVMFDVELEQIRLVSVARRKTTTRPVELKTQAEVRAETAAVAAATKQTTESKPAVKTPMQLAIEEGKGALEEAMKEGRRLEEVLDKSQMDGEAQDRAQIGGGR